MKAGCTPFRKDLRAHISRRSQKAGTLVEVLVSVLLIAIVSISLYAGLSSGFAVTKLYRENSRATQIMIQQMETIRLYRWSQLLSASPEPVYVPGIFVDYYDPAGKSSNAAGVVYNVKLTKSIPTNLPAAYQNNMRSLTVELTWNSGKVLRKRTMQTYVARSGLQNYVFK